MSEYFQVAVNFPKMQSVLTYQGQADLQQGDLVDVPLGKRSGQGIILNKSAKDDLDRVQLDKIKSVQGKIENAFSLGETELALYHWMSQYYHYSLGKLIFDCLPKILKRPRKPDFVLGEGKDFEFSMTPKQRNVFEQMSDKLNAGFSQHYVHGVTGSGKSFVYLQLIKEVLAQGKSAQFLLPEINLTPQFVQMFKEHLDCPILSYHSAVTPSEKYNIWKFLKESDTPVLVMGVRSSIFLPINNLGLIVVDEEHDSSFKQSDRCPYHGRDVAVKKAQLSNCPVVMGSATPTVENYYLFSQQMGGRYYYTMPERVGAGYFPKLLPMDMRDRFQEDDPEWPLLPETVLKIEERLERGEQVLVFINKLGYSHYIQCRNCGHQFKNEQCGCDNNLRFFKNRNYLSCAHCDYKCAVPNQCPECGSISLLNKGFGTEKVESVLSKIFKKHRVERFDRDEITTFKQLNEKLDRFHSGEIDILVGTQMLSKGHNFKKVNLVVILGIDSMLGFADFRSTEKTFQMLQQVAGRAGRYSPESEVIVQTMSPEHSLFKMIAENPFDGLYKNELPLREVCSCPPYSKVVMVFFTSRFRDRVVHEVNTTASMLRNVLMKDLPQVMLLGPSPLSIEKRANQYSWAFMLKSNDIKALHTAIATFKNNYPEVSGVSVKIDVDPQQIL